ncbi:MAG: DNA repair protein RecO [Anaerovoracaceae bacterium]
MITDTEGIVLRQVRTVGGRRMILLFSRKFGKINVGTSINEGGKNKSALAVRPFTNGRYELFKGRESYNLNSGQVLQSFYRIGEDLDKYMAASYVLELTEKLLPEELPQPRLYQLLLDFLEEMEQREKKHGTLVMAYMVKALDILGTMPCLDQCTACGCSGSEHLHLFSVEEGGMLCDTCGQQLRKENGRALIYEINFGIVDILKYFQKHPLSDFRRLALEEKTLEKLQHILRQYLAYHLDVKELKSEFFFSENPSGHLF